MTARCRTFAITVFAAAWSFNCLPAGAGETLTFERDVRPILKTYCIDCHGGGESLKGNLDLRLKRFAAKGGKNGPALVPGKADESLMIERLKTGEMPPGEKKVPPEQIVKIERWIAAGAVTSRVEPETLPPGLDITPEERAYWAFQPIRRPTPPNFGADSRVLTPIDAFILEKLQSKGLPIAPEADRRTLIRRAAFDLTGLLPSQDEIDGFVNDRDENAYEHMVDRLLESPHYGERWGRHWLDVAGYADSEGNGNEDSVRNYAYKYRDYVVRAFNGDKPLDQFIIEQLAGDELVPQPWANLTSAQTETLAATGFLRNAADGTATGAADEPLAANQVVADTLKIVGSSLLGLTVGCAQCHDHRYDPIPQSDYFRLRAVFDPALDTQHWRRPVQRLISLYTDADRAKAAAIEAEAQKLQKVVDEKTSRYVAEAIEKEMLKFPEPLRARLRKARETPAEKQTEAQKKLLASNPSLNLSAGVLYQYNAKAADELKQDNAKVAAKRAEKPVEDFLSVTNELPGAIPETKIFHRGDHRQPTRKVTPGDLTIASPEGARFEVPEKDAKLPTSGRRLAFAKHLVDGKHPLVGRVLVNRIWLNHFGRGLVDSPGDFGALGTRPTHLELLDWLADELVRGGWSLKHMHRVIMTSSVYRQISRHEHTQGSADSENTLFSHYPIRRLDAESLRDRILAIAGRLDSKLFGPPVTVAEDFVGLVLPENDSPRRSVYLQIRRTKPVSLLATFDSPVMTVNCDRRTPSTSAPQSLMLMNSDFVLNHAKVLAKRIRAETPADYATSLTSTVANKIPKSPLPAQFAYAWQAVYQRPISAEELEWTATFAVQQRTALEKTGGKDDHDLTVLTNLCQQLLSSNEFLYVD